MKDIIAFEHYYDVEFTISFWNEKLLRKGQITVDDLECFFGIAFPYNTNLVWTNLLTMDNFKRDKSGLYVLMVPDPKKNRLL
nr:MAG TPA: hypothetical protein [Caudoviricetes sp.]